MKGKTALVLTLPVVFIMLLLVLPALSPAAELDCTKCHEQLTKGKFVHKALDMGCTTCHGGIDAAAMPHKKKNSRARGLTSDQPELCYGCHDKGNFTKKNVHAAVAMGCTGCHNPHSSDMFALLANKPLQVCLQCHADSAEHGKHARPSGDKEPEDPKKPGRSFYCGSCHAPHSSNTPLLFQFDAQSVTGLCLNCHKY